MNIKKVLQYALVGCLALANSGVASAENAEITYTADLSVFHPENPNLTFKLTDSHWSIHCVPETSRVCKLIEGSNEFENKESSLLEIANGNPLMAFLLVVLPWGGTYSSEYAVLEKDVPAECIARGHDSSFGWLLFGAGLNVAYKYEIVYCPESITVKKYMAESVLYQANSKLKKTSEPIETYEVKAPNGVITVRDSKDSNKMDLESLAILVNSLFLNVENDPREEYMWSWYRELRSQEELQGVSEHKSDNNESKPSRNQSGQSQESELNIHNN